MHLLLIHQSFVGPGEPGGTRHFEFAKELVGEGHRVTVVASDLNYLTGRSVSGIERRDAQTVEGVRILRTFGASSLHRSFFWRVVSFLSFMASSVVTALRVGRVDLVMGTSPPLFQALSAWAVSCVRRRPFLLEIRDLWPEFAVDLGILKNKPLIFLARRLENFLYRRASHLLVNSPAYRTYLTGKGVPPEKISLIPNGVDPAMFRPESRGDLVRKRYGLDGKFVATYAGALGQANDIPTLLRAAERLKNEPDVRFLLVGDGKERKALEETSRSLGLTNVIFTGSVPKDEMADVLAASDACVAILQNIPMFRTTYPNKVFDYMAAGRPTLLAIDGVIREVMETSRGGLFVPPGDDAALTQAVLRLERDREEGRRMGQAARKFVEEHFDRRRQARQFHELIGSLQRKESPERRSPCIENASRKP